MSIIFTHFKKNKRKKISQFLESEIEHIDNLISVVSAESTLNKVLIDYSKSLFFVSNEDDNDTVILN